MLTHEDKSNCHHQQTPVHSQAQTYIFTKVFETLLCLMRTCCPLLSVSIIASCGCSAIIKRQIDLYMHIYVTHFSFKTRQEYVKVGIDEINVIFVKNWPISTVRFLWFCKTVVGFFVFVHRLFFNRTITESVKYEVKYRFYSTWGDDSPEQLSWVCITDLLCLTRKKAERVTTALYRSKNYSVPQD